MKIINKLTGKEPTAAEWKQIKARAGQILENPYSAPELVAWAAEMDPEKFAKVGLMLLRGKNDAN